MATSVECSGWARRYLGVFLLTCCVCLAHIAGAAEINLAVVDVEAILTRLPERAAVETELKERLAILQAEVDAKWKEVAELSKSLEGNQALLSDVGVAKRQEALIQKETELSAYWNAMAEKIRAETKSVSEALSAEVEGVITDFAVSNAYDVVFDKNSGKLIYATGAFDCTDAVMKAVLARSISADQKP